MIPVTKAAVKNMAHTRLLHFEIAFAIFLCLDYAGYAFQNLHAKALKGADLPGIVGLHYEGTLLQLPAGDVKAAAPQKLWRHRLKSRHSPVYIGGDKIHLHRPALHAPDIVESEADASCAMKSAGLAKKCSWP